MRPAEAEPTGIRAKARIAKRTSLLGILSTRKLRVIAGTPSYRSACRAERARVPRRANLYVTSLGCADQNTQFAACQAPPESGADELLHLLWRGHSQQRQRV